MQEKIKGLIVEDSAIYRKLVVDGLRDLDRNIELDEAETLIDAVKKATNTQYQFLVVDLMLPDATGVEAIKVLRQLTVIPSQPPSTIIAMTATNANADEVINAGADDFIEKNKAMSWIESLDQKIRYSRVRNRSRPFAVAVERLDKMDSILTRIKNELDKSPSPKLKPV